MFSSENFNGNVYQHTKKGHTNSPENIAGCVFVYLASLSMKEKAISLISYVSIKKSLTMVVRPYSKESALRGSRARSDVDRNRRGSCFE